MKGNDTDRLLWIADLSPLLSGRALRALIYLAAVADADLHAPSSLIQIAKFCGFRIVVAESAIAQLKTLGVISVLPGSSITLKVYPLSSLIEIERKVYSSGLPIERKVYSSGLPDQQENPKSRRRGGEGSLRSTSRRNSSDRAGTKSVRPKAAPPPEPRPRRKTKNVT